MKENKEGGRERDNLKLIHILLLISILKLTDKHKHKHVDLG